MIPERQLLAEMKAAHNNPAYARISFLMGCGIQKRGEGAFAYDQNGCGILAAVRIKTVVHRLRYENCVATVGLCSVRSESASTPGGEPVWSWLGRFPSRRSSVTR